MTLADHSLTQSQKPFRDKFGQFPLLINQCQWKLIHWKKAETWSVDISSFLLSGYFHPRKGELLLDDIAFRHSMRGDDDDEDDGDHNDKKDGGED